MTTLHASLRKGMRYLEYSEVTEEDTNALERGRDCPGENSSPTERWRLLRAGGSGWAPEVQELGSLCLRFV